MECMVNFFFFQAEDGIRDAQESRGLGDVYKRQKQRRIWKRLTQSHNARGQARVCQSLEYGLGADQPRTARQLSLIHI